jgi:hypothetical protein
MKKEIIEHIGFENYANTLKPDCSILSNVSLALNA